MKGLATKSVILVTGTGYGVGKTLVASILAEAMEADYWKPIETHYDKQPDSERVARLISNSRTIVHPEVYKLKQDTSPYYAAKKEGVKISLEKVFAAYCLMASSNNTLVVEGCGGLIEPINETEFISDLVRVLNARVILVSGNSVDSVNHSLLTSKMTRQKNLRVLGWVFSDANPLNLDDIARWSGFPKIGSIPHIDTINKQAIRDAAASVKQNLIQALPPQHVES
ncbi:MAG: dethiobiotin synthase [Chitinophagaceae bacterium]